MRIEDIQPKPGAAALVPVTAQAVRDASLQLGASFPSGYEEYVTRFGKGLLGGTWVRVYMPSQIVLGLARWRERIDQYWFWDKGRETLTKAKALQCIVFADTWDGDEVVFHPSEPEKIYVLPRHSEAVHIASESGLLKALEWLCSSGVITEAFTDRFFEPDRDEEPHAAD